MRRALHLLALALALGLTTGLARAAAGEFSGELRLDVVGAQAAKHGPVAAANALVPDFIAQPQWSVAPQAELHGSLGPVHAIGTLGYRYNDQGHDENWARFNELYASASAAPWEFTGGRRIVSWDVGDGFRPNDVVQQEPRRLLLPVLPVGRDLLMADRFGTDTAFTAVLVNPQHDSSARGPEEPALAGRFYLRHGPADWHVIARWGERTHGSLGAAVAWVATDALEVHASVRYLDSADVLAINPAVLGLANVNPWQDATVHHATQALVGMRWAGEQRQSLLLEAWWDGTAPSDAQWESWLQRNAQIGGATLAPALARAGNLAWQTSAFDASINLHRLNVFGRASIKLEDWEPAVSLLYNPADAGRSLTASLAWQGDRVRVEVGARINTGPSDAVLAQVPVHRTAYATTSWHF